MRLAGLIIGLLGAAAGFVGAVLAIAFGGLGQALDAEGAGMVTSLGFLALGASIVGLVGAALSMGKPRLAASLMFVSAFVGTVAVSYAYVFAALLLVIGAGLTFLGRHRRASEGQ